MATAETLGSCAEATGDIPDPECTVTVTATDSAGDASIPVATVTIKITNVDEKPTFSTTDDAIGLKMISSVEGMTALADAVADVTYSAMDPEDLSLTYHLMGPDGAKFQLSPGGVLSFKTAPDYEKPTDRNKDNVYEVTVRASDGTMYADHMVMVTVTDANEAPEIMGKDSVNYAENGEGPVATFTATDPEGVTPIAWSVPTNLTADNIDGIEDADDVDNGVFEIDEDGVLKFISPPDYEASGRKAAGTKATTTPTTWWWLLPTLRPMLRPATIRSPSRSPT